MHFPTPEARAKREKLSELLDLGLVSIQLDPRVAGVVVPPQFIGQPALTLNLSRRFRAPDLDLSHDAVRVTLSFNGDRSRCELPWDSIFAMVSAVDDGGFLFTDAVPEELADMITSAPTQAAAPAPMAEEPPEETPTAETGDDPSKPPSPGLRLVE